MAIKAIHMVQILLFKNSIVFQLLALCSQIQLQITLSGG